MESTQTQIYGYRAGSTRVQVASAPTLLYAEDATLYCTVLGKEEKEKGTILLHHLQKQQQLHATKEAQDPSRNYMRSFLI